MFGVCTETLAGIPFVVVLVFRLEHFVGKFKVMFHTCENFTGMVLSTIPSVVKHDLPGRVVTVTWVVHYVGSHSRLTVPPTEYGKLFTIAQVWKTGTTRDSICIIAPFGWCPTSRDFREVGSGATESGVVSHACFVMVRTLCS